MRTALLFFAIMFSLSCFSQTAVNDHVALAQVKYFIVIGNYEMARQLLNTNQIKNLKGNLKATKLRYESIIEFNDKNFRKAHAILKSPELSSFKAKHKTCTMRLMLEIIYEKNKELSADWNECIRKNNVSPFWAKKIIQMYFDKGPHRLIKEMNEILVDKLDLQHAKDYLKLSLFIQQETIFLDRLSEFPQEFFNDKEIREIVGMLYYRTGQLTKAFNFIEDLTYTNAENIKGDLLMLQEKYEIAFPQFKLVWANRFNSNEALLRAFPISWEIKEWEDGLNILYKIPDEYIDDELRYLFQTLLLTALNKSKEANKNLKKITSDSLFFKVYEVREIQSFLALFEEDKTTSRYYSEKSCQLYHPIHCWLYKQHDYWENLGLTMKRDEEILPNTKSLLEKLKYPEETKLSEEVVIDQKYIEELDRADLINY